MLHLYEIAVLLLCRCTGRSAHLDSAFQVLAHMVVTQRVVQIIREKASERAVN